MILERAPQVSTRPTSGVAMPSIHLSINGRDYAVDANPQTSLLTVLREHLDLTGSKYGCGEGQCGACTVLIDGKAQRSCITRVSTVGQKQSRRSKDSPKANNCIPCNRRFSMQAQCNAPTARRE